MAKALAAVATMPSGATIYVVTIRATARIVCSPITGAEICRHCRSWAADHRGFSPRRIRSSGERASSVYSSTSVLTTCASAVPAEAPITPRPAPGRSTPSTRSVPPGKIRNALNITSKRHMDAMHIPGVFMLPEARSRPAHRLLSCKNGRDSAYTRK